MECDLFWIAKIYRIYGIRLKKQAALRTTLHINRAFWAKIYYRKQGAATVNRRRTSHLAKSVIRTNGLIIKEQKVSENDRLGTVLTAELGVIRAFSKNSLKSTSKSLSSTAFLSYSRLYIYKGRDTYKIGDAAPLKIFWDLRQDFSKLSLASYFCEVVSRLAPKDENAEEYLRLILNCLHLLSLKEEPVPEVLIKAIFGLRCCLYSGYMPDIYVCRGCNEELVGNAWFDILNGVFYCDKCREKFGKVKLDFVPSSVLCAMKYILTNPLNKCFGFKINEKSAKILGNICEKFLIVQSDHTFDTLQFYKTYKI